MAQVLISRASRTFRVQCIGGAGRRTLAAGTGLRLLAVFRRSLYVQARSGGTICLGPPSLGPGPLNALVGLPAVLDWRALDLASGAGVAWDGATLDLDGRFWFSLQGAEPWRPPAPPPAWSPATIAANLPQLQEEIDRRHPTVGLAPLISALLTGGPLCGSDGSPLHRRAAAGVSALRSWLITAVCRGDTDPPRAPEIARLIGLGPGLTPSGDDLLGGALITLHVLGCSHVAGHLAGRLLPVARQRTHALSLAHLLCAARGEGAAAVHETIGALCSPGSKDLAVTLDSLAEIGHSSGWDALAGVSVVCRAVAGADPIPPRPSTRPS